MALIERPNITRVSTHYDNNGVEWRYWDGNVVVSSVTWTWRQMDEYSRQTLCGEILDEVKKWHST